MTEYKLRNKSGQLCGMLYRAQNRDLFYVILDTTNNQPHCIQLKAGHLGTLVNTSTTALRLEKIPMLNFNSKILW